MAIEVGAESASVAGPHLDTLIASSGHDNGSRSRRESHAGHPFGVAVLNNGELAFAQGVPQLDSSVARARDDLSVVGREGDREHILGVANEATSALSRGNLPQTQSAIPRTRESELAINTGDNVRDEVVVTTKSTTGISVVALLASDGPNDDGLRKNKNQH